MDTQKQKSGARILVALVGLITVLCISLSVFFYTWVSFQWIMLQDENGLTELPFGVISLELYKALLDLVGGFKNYLLVNSSLIICCSLAIVVLVFLLYQKYKQVLQRYDELYSEVEMNRSRFKEKEKEEKFPWQPPVE